jgi:hypothetical protein
MGVRVDEPRENDAIGGVERDGVREEVNLSPEGPQVADEHDRFLACREATVPDDPDVAQVIPEAWGGAGDGHQFRGVDDGQIRFDHAVSSREVRRCPRPAVSS